MTSSEPPTLDHTDLELALAYGPARLKTVLRLIWRLDVTLASALAKAHDPVLAQIRLAWWREQLGDRRKWALARDPILLSLYDMSDMIADPATLSGLAEAWSLLAGLDDDADFATWEKHATLRGQALFGAVSPVADVLTGGRVWVLAELRARLSGNATMSSNILGRASLDAKAIDWATWPKSLRPLEILTRFALSDLDDEASGRVRRSRFHRLWLAARHGLKP